MEPSDLVVSNLAMEHHHPIFIILEGNEYWLREIDKKAKI